MSISSAILELDPTAYYPLASSASDASGNSNHGTVQGGAQFVSVEDFPMFGRAIDLDGSNDYVSTSYSPFVNGTVRTFVGLARRDGSGAIHTFFGGSGATQPAFRLASGSTDVVLVLGAGAQTVTWTAAWPGNSISAFVVFEVDLVTNTAELWIDGVSQGTKTLTTTWGATPGSFVIGARLAGSNPFDGLMQHVAVFERGLAADEIESLYTSVASAVFYTSDGDPIALEPLGSAVGAVGVFYEKEAERDFFPVPRYDERYAETDESEGGPLAKRVARNSSGSGVLAVIGSSEADLSTRLDNLQSAIESIGRRGGTIRHKAVTYEVLSMKMSEVPRDSLLDQGYVQRVGIEYTCLPYGILTEQTQLLTDSDPFSRDTITEGRWLFDAGSGTIEVLSGVLAMVTTAEKRLYRPIKSLDSTTTFKVRTGASGAGDALAIFKRLDTSNYLRAGYLSTGDLKIQKVVAGVVSDLAVDATATLLPSTNYWVSIEIDGNAISAGIYLADPALGGSALYSAQHTLAGGDATQFGAAVRGNPGIMLTPAGVDWTADDFRHDAELIEASLAQMDFELRDVPGHADALGTLNVKDLATQNRGHVEVGLEHEKYNPANPTPLYWDSDQMTAIGGTGGTQSGAFDPNAAGNSVISATMTTNPVVVASGSATVGPKGSWKFRARGHYSADGIMVRLAWRVGGGAWRRERWKQPPSGLAAGFYDVDLATINIDEDAIGTHKFEFQIEAKSTTLGDTYKIDVVWAVPAERYFVSRSKEFGDLPSGGVVAYDGFDTHTVDTTLIGKTPPLAPAGLWSEAGDLDDFFVRTNATYGGQCAKRDAVSDTALDRGQYARCGSGTLSGITLNCDVYLTAPSSAQVNLRRSGVFLRSNDFTDASEDLVMVVYECVNNSGWGEWRFTAYKYVAGLQNTIASDVNIGNVSGWRSLGVYIGADGEFLTVEGAKGGTQYFRHYKAPGADTDLTGGLLTGGYGIYDANQSGTDWERAWDNFVVQTAVAAQSAVDYAVNSGFTARFTGTNARKQTASAAWAEPSGFTGSRFRVPPATVSGRVSRAALKVRRADVDSWAEDTGLTDATEVTCTVRPRVALLSP